MTPRSELAAGARAAAPMLAAIIPFGFVTGAAASTAGIGVAPAVAMSTFVLAGASQLAMIDVLGSGGSALVAALAAVTINLRMLLYSASLAPFLAHEPLRRRLAAASVTVDQNYALAISRWANPDLQPHAAFIVGGGLTLAPAWILCTAIGAVAGNALPEDLPLDFSIPLVFLVLLVPVLVTRPAIASAAGGGVAAVAAAQAGAGPWSVMIGAGTGIAVGTIVDWLGTRDADG